MHELSITRNIVALVSERSGNRRVRRITLEIGVNAAIVPASIEFCFGVVAAGTPCEGALLDIRKVEGRARCRICAREFALLQLGAPCACGSYNLERLRGGETQHQRDGNRGGVTMCTTCGCSDGSVVTLRDMSTGRDLHHHGDGVLHSHDNGMLHSHGDDLRRSHSDESEQLPDAASGTTHVHATHGEAHVHETFGATASA